MKKVIAFIPILFFLAFFVFNTEVVFASSCQQIGNTTFCDDGTSYQQIGNTTFGSDGTSYQRIGNTTFGSDGTSYQQIGNTTFGSDGTSYQRIGNTTFGSDGSSYQRIGNTTFGSGGGNVYNSCPANSSYDSSTGKCSCNYGYSVNSTKTACVYTSTYNYTYPTTPTCPANSYYDGVSSCKCNYGYVVSGSSCVYQGTTYSNAPTYSATQNTCPINSHISATDSTMCQCDVGYQPNSTKDGCVLSPVKSNDQLCQDNFGVNVIWDGTKTNDGRLNCNCKTNYIWNTGRTACIPTPTTYTPPKTKMKVVAPILSPKKEIKTADVVKVYQKESPATQSNSGAEKKWYQKIFDWLFN